MSDKSRVPKAIAKFNTYIVNTDGVLQAATAPYRGVTAGDITTWHGYFTSWGPLYIKYSDTAIRTKSITKQVQDLMKAFRTFAEPLLNTMAASSESTSDDEATFNFKKTHAKPSHPTASIEAECFASIKHNGIGKFKVSCRSKEDSSRASIADGADSVQYAYLLTDDRSTIPTPDDDVMRLATSSKSSFDLDFGTKAQRKWLIIYFRWFNSKYPKLAGPWADVQIPLVN